jgi:hypothetical protein
MKPEEVRVLWCSDIEECLKHDLTATIEIWHDPKECDLYEGDGKCFDRPKCDAKEYALYDPETHKLVEVK